MISLPSQLHSRKRCVIDFSPPVRAKSLTHFRAFRHSENLKAGSFKKHVRHAAKPRRLICAVTEMSAFGS